MNPFSSQVEVNSPADLAGLLPDKDYLLGTAEKKKDSFFNHHKLRE